MALEQHGPFRIWIDEQEITGCIETMTLNQTPITFGTTWSEALGRSIISMFPTDEATGATLDDLLGEDQ